MASSSRSFGIDPDGYGPEPQLNREELLAAVTVFVFGRTHSHSLTQTHPRVTGTNSSGSHRSESLVDSDTQPGDWCECGNCEPCSEMRRVECKCCADAVLPVHQYTELRRESQKDQPYKCVTEHPCFHALCLYPRMLAVREVSYRREFGRTLPGSWDHNTKMRYIAYSLWYSW